MSSLSSVLPTPVLHIRLIMADTFPLYLTLFYERQKSQHHFQEEGRGGSSGGHISIGEPKSFCHLLACFTVVRLYASNYSSVFLPFWSYQNLSKSNLSLSNHPYTVFVIRVLTSSFDQQFAIQDHTIHSVTSVVVEIVKSKTKHNCFFIILYVFHLILYNFLFLVSIQISHCSESWIHPEIVYGVYFIAKTR